MRFFACTLGCAVALASVSLAGCGSVDGPGGGGDDGDDVSADFQIAVQPTTLTVPIAGTKSATVTITRSGAIGDVMLSASGLGSNLTVEFTPNPVPAAMTTSEAKITVAGGSVAASTGVTLTGSAGGTTHAAQLQVTSTTISVNGTVRGNRSGVKVGILGKPSITSGAGGVFSFADVTPPYDLYTFAPGGSTTVPTPTVFLFKGLTRTDPIVSAATTSTPGIRVIRCGLISACPNAPVSGTKAGSGTNTDAVAFAWTDGSFSGTLAATGSYSGTITWNSGSTNQGVLHALQLTRRASGAPNTFLGYAKSSSITLTDGTAATINLNFTAVSSTATLTGTLNGPAGYPSPTITLFQQFGDTQAALWQNTTTNTVDATFPLIAAAGGTSLFASTSLDGGLSQFVQPLTGTVALNFTMPAAAVLGGPAASETGVTTSTHFVWTSAATTINEVDIDAQTAGLASYRIFTTASDVTIPVVAELTLPANQAFGWSVNAYGPNSSIDEAAAANELETVISSDYQGPAHARTSSPGRGFTSAP